MALRRAYAAMVMIGICVSIGCETEADRQRQAASVAAQLRAQEMARERAERSNVLQNPGGVLQTSDLKYFDRGFLNSYRQLTGVTVLNTSKFPLNNLRGEVDWLAEDGAKFGSVPFTLKGSIPAGDTKVFSESNGTLTSGTLQGNAKRARLRFTSVEIVGTPSVQISGD